MNASTRSRFILAATLFILMAAGSSLPLIWEWGFSGPNDPWVLPYTDAEFLYPPAAYLLVEFAAKLLTTYVSPYHLVWYPIIINCFLFLSLALIVFLSPGKILNLIGRVLVVVLGFVLLSDIGPLPEASDIVVNWLPWWHYDMAPGALLLAACFARIYNRKIIWPFLLGLSGAAKLFAFAVLPGFLKDSPQKIRALAIAAIPAILSLLFILFVDNMTVATENQTGRMLHMESSWASVLYAAHFFQEGIFEHAYVAYAYDVVGPLTTELGTVSFVFIALFLIAINGYFLKYGGDLLVFTTTAITGIVLLAPVFSPQFLLWILPLSGAAFALGRENAVLLVVAALTNAVLVLYEEAIDMTQLGMVLMFARSTALALYFFLLLHALWKSSSLAKAQAE